MDEASAVKITVDGVQLDQKVDKENLIWDFYYGQRLVDSYFLTDRKIRHAFTFTDDFEYVKILIRSVDGGILPLQALLTFSFFHECSFESTNTQWIPLSDSSDQFLVSTDFNAHSYAPPCIKLKFEMIDSIREFSSAANQTSKSVEK